jgi:hypothetical protein
MEISVEINLIAMQPPRNMISKRAYKAKFSFFKKQNAFLFGKALLILYFFCYCKEVFV